MSEESLECLKPLLKNRINDSHKGSYGHLLIVAGCQDMPGAAVLATSAALQSGCGLVTLHSTRRALDAATVSCPSAMLSLAPGECLGQIPAKMSKYSAICIGPGLGQAPETLETLSAILTYSKEHGIPLLLDADALNMLAKKPAELTKISEGSILTPHTEELRRLLTGAGIVRPKDSLCSDGSNIRNENSSATGNNANCRYYANSAQETAIRKLCSLTNSTIIAKGYHSRIFEPNGKLHQIMVGGPGLAKAGSGDVLAGLTAGLMARGYADCAAAILGTWIHGKTGDLLSGERTPESFNSFDLAQNLFQAFKILYS